MSQVEKKRNVSLVGFMCSGKSTIGREAAYRTGLELVDIDDLIENRAGMTIADIFSRYGEDYFRDLETSILEEVMERKNQLLITGGGIVIREMNRKRLRQSTHVIWLRIGIDEVMRRLSRNDDRKKRPLIEKNERKGQIAALLEGRERFYRDCDVVVDVDGKKFADVVDQVTGAIRKMGFTGKGLDRA